MKKVKLTDQIAPSFYNIHNYIKDNKYTHYWLKGGRGSTKSSFAATEIPLNIMRDGNNGIMTNAIIIRRYAVTLSGSVVEQIKWAIERSGQAHLWEIPKAKLEFTYKPTGQKILFKGADDEEKLKSSKVSVGYFKYIWYEELTEFEGMEKIRSINQSLMRGGQDFCILYTYNPPKSVRSWVNTEAGIPQADRLTHHSTYLTVPQEWLGRPFIIEAEHLKEVNLEAYRHEYLGEVVGTGGEVFKNIVSQEITDEDIKHFDNIKQGLDFGYSIDPLAYIQGYYDKTRRRLYLFDEIYKTELSNRKAAKMIQDKLISNSYIVADSAEPKSIAELRSYGLKVIGARKGPDSIEYGIKFLQGLEAIIIDPVRCPNAYKEFTNYELERDRRGELKGKFPDKDNHIIDACRYALEDEMKANGKLRTINKTRLGL